MRTTTGSRRRAGQPRSLVGTLIVLNCLLQAFLVPPATAHIDFLTKLKLLGLLAIAKKIEIVPVPLPIPIPIHIEGKEEVLYMKAPAPAYSYAPSTHSYEYASPSEQHYGGKGEGGGGGHYQGAKGAYHKEEGNYHGAGGGYAGHDAAAAQHGDYAGYASEVVPVATSFRYGERIPPGGAAAAAAAAARPSSAAAPAAARPNRVTGVHRGRGQPRHPAQQQFVPSTTPAPVVVAHSQPLENDYTPVSAQQSASNFDQSVGSGPETEVPVKIALIPFKSLDLASLEQPQQQPAAAAAVPNEVQQNPQHSSQHSLPENLLNYIREVHRTLPEGKPARPVENKPKPVVSEPIAKPAVVEIAKPKDVVAVAAAQPSKPSAPAQPAPAVVPTQYQSIQSSWLTPQHQYQPKAHTVPYPGGYRAPELKVIRTKYDPKQQQLQEEQWKHQQPQSSQQQQGVNKVQPPQQPVQFLYSVTHDSPPPPASTPTFFSTPLFASQAPANYPVLDNFGLAQFHASQNQNQHQKPRTQNQWSTLGSHLTPAASFASTKWIEAPASLQYDDTFGHRIPKHL